MAITRAVASSITQGLPKKRTILAGNPTILPGSYESIQTITVGAGGSSLISFTSIPSTYTHLQLRCIGQLNNADVSAYIRFNNDTTSTNTGHWLQADGSSAISGGTSSDSTAKFIFRPSYTALGSSIFGVAIIDILDYANTNKNKTSRSLTGFDANGSGYLNFNSNLWTNTAAVNRVDITTNNSFVQYSSFALYGIK